jgi:hypothetical protein
VEGKLVFNSIIICLAKELSIDNRMLKQICISLMESRVKTGFEIWSLEDGWKVVEEVYELFCKRVMGGVNAISEWCLYEDTGEDKQETESVRESNEIWAKTVGNRSGKFIRGCIRIEKGKGENNWMGRIKQALERMGMRDIWKHASSNNKNIWVIITERYAYIEKENI